MTKKELFCEDCNGMRDTTPKATEITHKIRGEEITVIVNVPFCSECGCELSDLDVEEYHHDLALNEYRKRKGLLYSEQIKAIREKYGLSQRAFARALGFAEPTINRYELGALQDTLHNNILLLVNEPSVMLKMASLNKENLSEKEFSYLVETLTKIKPPSETQQDGIIGYIVKNIDRLNKKMDELLKDSKRATHTQGLRTQLHDDDWEINGLPLQRINPFEPRRSLESEPTFSNWDVLQNTGR
ncbi:MAG TPA: type II TA system antitoxin MqsA family protein [Desulfosporosinus sp.]|nr:type II TA system antitoxin MqsA family protein [Desulfosporosinus sp.]